MHLLDPKEIKREKSENTEQAKSRTKKLATEETRLVLKINLARENAIKEIEKINAEVAENKKLREAEKRVLIQEVETLKEQKKILLLPIEDIKKEAETILRFAETKKSEYEKKIIEIEKDKNEIREIRNEFRNKENKLDKLNEELNAREIQIVKEEERLNQSSNNLAIEWINYQKIAEEQKQKEDDLMAQSESLKTREDSIDIRQKEQDERDKVLYNETRAIRSGYAALEQAKIHLGIK